MAEQLRGEKSAEPTSWHLGEQESLKRGQLWRVLCGPVRSCMRQETTVLSPLASHDLSLRVGDGAEAREAGVSRYSARPSEARLQASSTGLSPRLSTSMATNTRGKKRGTMGIHRLPSSVSIRRPPAHR